MFSGAQLATSPSEERLRELRRKSVSWKKMPCWVPPDDRRRPAEWLPPSAARAADGKMSEEGGALDGKLRSCEGARSRVPSRAELARRGRGSTISALLLASSSTTALIVPRGDRLALSWSCSTKWPGACGLTGKGATSRWRPEERCEKCGDRGPPVFDPGVESPAMPSTPVPAACLAAASVGEGLLCSDTWRRRVSPGDRVGLLGMVVGGAATGAA